MASVLSISENGTGGGGLGAAVGGACWKPSLPATSSDVVITGVIVEYGGAVGEEDRSVADDVSGGVSASACSCAAGSRRPGEGGMVERQGCGQTSE